MRYLAAYLLLVEGGNATPAVADLKDLIESVGVEFEQSKAEAIIAAFEGKSVQELIAEGSAKFASMPSGGAAASGSSAAAGGASEAAAEEAEEEEEEESDDDMGFGLFD